jgi:hypothetical protein
MFLLIINAFKNALALSLTKPSVLLMAWFLMSVATFLPSWSVLPELVEPRAVRAAPASHRLLVEDDMAIVGINVFTDYETKSRHRRLSLGLEYQRTNFSANINKYHRLNSFNTIVESVCIHPINTHLTATRTKCI